MHNLSKLFILGLLMFANLTIMAQVRIPGTKVSFEFPHNGWKYQSTMEIDNNTTLYLYAFAGDYVIDAVGDTILPYMRIYVRKNFKGSIYDLAYSRFMQQPFEALNNYTAKQAGTEMLGYVGAYTSTLDKKDYQFRMVYFKDKETAFEIRLESTYDTYSKMDDEFESILKTINIEK